MPKGTLAALAALLVALSPSSAWGQVEARQGTTPLPDITNFDSPMILDLPLPNIAEVEAGSRLQLPKVRKFTCDRDVALLNLTMTKNHKSRRDRSSLLLVVSGAVLVADSYDRRVDIGLRIKSGEQVLTSQLLRNLKAEEERSTPFGVTLPITDSALRGAFESQTPPTLELTLTVRDDS